MFARRYEKPDFFLNFKMPLLTSSHWGVYEGLQEEGKAVGLKGFGLDPDPSPIGLSVFDATTCPMRVRCPSVRKSWLDTQRARQAGDVSTREPLTAEVVASELRGQETFVEVSCGEVLELVADSLKLGST